MKFLIKAALLVFPLNLAQATLNGSVLFSNGQAITEDNANFYWRNTTKVLRLGNQLLFGDSTMVNPPSSAAIGITGVRGIQLPSVTTAQSLALSGVWPGTFIYNSDLGYLQVYNGSSWTSGLVGPAGPQGATGAQGPQGTAGSTGSTGATGPAGVVAATSPLAYNSGTQTVSIQAASTSQAGSLSASDWNTFNGKQSSLSFSAPLTNSSGTVSIPVSTGSVNGYLSSSDWATFNGKQAALSFTTPLSNSSGTISMPVSTSSANGYLSSTDWVTFNGKVSTARSISTTAPLSGGGDLSANRTLSMAASTNSVDGYLTAADHTTFAAKEPAISAGTTDQYWRGDKSWQTLTTAVVAEVTNLYFTTARVLATALAGLNTTAGTITSSDTILGAIGKLVGNLALKFGSVTYTALSASRSFNANFTPSSTLVTDVCYSVKIACSISLGGACEGTVDLRSDTNATPTTSIGQANMALGGTLLVGLVVSNSQITQVCGRILPGNNVRIVTTTVSGSPTFTLVGSREITQGFAP